MQSMHTLAICLAAGASALAPAALFAQDAVPVARYTLVRPTAGPDQMDPLKTVVSLSFPRGRVQTVGDAVQHLLARSGYELEDDTLVPGSIDAHRRLIAFPLPEIHRRFDTVAIDQVLLALAGQSYEPKIDHLNRTVSFDLRALPTPLPPREAPAPAAPGVSAPDPSPGPLASGADEEATPTATPNLAKSPTKE